MENKLPTYQHKTDVERKNILELAVYYTKQDDVNEYEPFVTNSASVTPLFTAEAQHPDEAIGWWQEIVTNRKKVADMFT